MILSIKNFSSRISKCFDFLPTCFSFFCCFCQLTHHSFIDFFFFGFLLFYFQTSALSFLFSYIFVFIYIYIYIIYIYIIYIYIHKHTRICIDMYIYIICNILIYVIIYSQQFFLSIGLYYLLSPHLKTTYNIVSPGLLSPRDVPDPVPESG